MKWKEDDETWGEAFGNLKDAIVEAGPKQAFFGLTSSLSVLFAEWLLEKAVQYERWFYLKFDEEE